MVEGLAGRPGVWGVEGRGEGEGATLSASELSESLTLLALDDLCLFLFFSFSSYLLGGFGFRPDKVSRRKAGLGDSFSSSSSSEDSSSFSSVFSCRLLGLLGSFSFSFSTFGLRPRLAPAAWLFSCILSASFWVNCWMSRGSRMFSSGSHVEYLGLHPFHLTRYSVLPLRNLFLVMASAANTWSPSSCSCRPSIM